MLRRMWFLQSPDDEDTGGGGSVPPADAPDAVPPPLPSDTPPPPSGTETPPPESPAPDTPAPENKDIPPNFPENWRETVSKGDAKKIEKLSRYASVEAAMDALFNAQEKISKGIVKKIGKDATPEQIKEYRASLGVPETPDKYDVADLKLPATDKPMIDAFLKEAHESNQTPEQVQKSLKAFYKIQGEQVAARNAQDSQIMQGTEDALRAEWGDNYRKNITLVEGFIAGAPPEIGQKLIHGRLADGTPVGSSPEVLRWLLSLELERNPSATITPRGSGDLLTSVTDEKKEIESFMAKNRAAYNKDEKMQARYRDLIQFEIDQAAKSKK